MRGACSGLYAFLAGALWLTSLLACTDSHGKARYIGREACSVCHAPQAAAWKGSHHDLSMQVATEETVRGDFSGVEFSLFGVVSHFYRGEDGRFMVRTEGPDGELHDYPIAYTLGVYPLQQYLIAFPGGRLQALDIAWDSRPRSEGGERWFALHSGERIPPGEPLHWTGAALNWNHMCADCHSTALKKNFDNVTAGYRTRWQEMDVSCEACHGPGSEHRRWAEEKDRGGAYALPGKGLTIRFARKERGTDKRESGESGLATLPAAEIEVCARCHSRRSQLHDDFVPGQPFLDAFQPALLTPDLYHPDGQVKEEVYVWGSFLQSRMFQAGVTCSDCHDPHTARLKAEGKGKVCFQCHQEDRYASSRHHFHREGVPASPGCPDCHMPVTVFMGVDRRHDHGFRIPRPDLTEKTGTPNACNQCHTSKTAGWAVQKLKTWYGETPRGYQRFAIQLQALWSGRNDAGEKLVQLAGDASQPAIARASGLAALGLNSELAPGLHAAIRKNLSSPDPLLQLGALLALEGAPLKQRMEAMPLVEAGTRSIRITAGRLLADVPRDQLGAKQRKALEGALRDYIQAQRFNGERAESHVNLASLYQVLHDHAAAEAAYRKAIAIQPRYLPAQIGLAQLLGRLGREQEAAELLQKAIERMPEAAVLHHALGLSRVRQGNLTAALRSLAAAAELDPDNARYLYVQAVARWSVGERKQALHLLERGQLKWPANTEILGALIQYHREEGMAPQALRYAKKLQLLLPQDPRAIELVRELEEEEQMP